MPYAAFGEDATFEKRGGDFLKLKSKGDKAHIRLIGSPYYNGKHFLQEEDGWKVHPCTRIMNEEKCDICEEYFTLLKEAKALKELSENSKELEDKQKEARKHKAKITFYYPVIDRETETFAIFETSLSVRLKIDEDVKNGIDPTKYDYVVTRTESPGANYYSVVRMDSADAKELSEKELEAVEIGKKYDVANAVEGTKSNQFIELLEEQKAKVKPAEQMKESVDPEIADYAMSHNISYEEAKKKIDSEKPFV